MHKNGLARLAMVAVAGLSPLLVPGTAGAVGTLISFTSSGSGCPMGTVDYYYDDATDVLTLSFADFSMTLPPGLSTPCNLTLVLEVPPDYQVSVGSIEYNGYLDTDATVTARLFALMKYGTNPPSTMTETVTGGYTGPWNLKDVPMGSSDCGGTMTILANTRISLSGTPSLGHTNEFALSGPNQMQFQFTPCGTAKPTAETQDLGLAPAHPGR